MDLPPHVPCVTRIVTALERVGIDAVYDANAGGFLLLRRGCATDTEDLWERALSAPFLPMSRDELASPECVSIAWGKANHVLQAFDA